MADVGQGTIITLERSNVAIWDGEVVGLRLPEESVTIHPTTLLTDTQEKFTTGRIKKRGQLRITTNFDPRDVPPAPGGADVDIEVTFPAAAGEATGPKLTATGKYASRGEVSVDADGVMTQELAFNVEDLAFVEPVDA